MDNRFKFVNFKDRVKRRSKIETNGRQPDAHVKGELTSSSNVTCNRSSNQLEMSNIPEMVDNGREKRELVDLEGVVETNLGQSYEKIMLLQNLKIAIAIMSRLLAIIRMILTSQTTKSMFLQMYLTLTF